MTHLKVDLCEEGSMRVIQFYPHVSLQTSWSSRTLQYQKDVFIYWKFRSLGWNSFPSSKLPKSQYHYHFQYQIIVWCPQIQSSRGRQSELGKLIGYCLDSNLKDSNSNHLLNQAHLISFQEIEEYILSFFINVVFSPEQLHLSVIDFSAMTS